MNSFDRQRNSQKTTHLAHEQVTFRYSSTRVFLVLSCTGAGQHDINKSDRATEHESDRVTGQGSDRTIGQRTERRQHSPLAPPTTVLHRSSTNYSASQQLCPRLHSTSAQPNGAFYLNMNVEFHTCSHA